MSLVPGASFLTMQLWSFANSVVVGQLVVVGELVVVAGFELVVEEGEIERLVVACG